MTNYVQKTGFVSHRVGGLNVRDDASKGANISDKLAPGDKVYVIRTDDAGKWAYVRVEKTAAFGYVWFPDIDLEVIPLKEPEPPLGHGFALGILSLLALVALGVYVVTKAFGLY